MSERWSLLFTDLNNQRCQTRFDTIDAPGLSLAPIAAASSAFFADYWVGTIVRNPAPAPSSIVVWSSVRDTALILYSGAVADTIASVWIPAPKFIEPPADPGVFAGDAYTVDPGLVADITAETFARLQNAGGAVCFNFNGGQRFTDLGPESLLIPGDGYSFIHTTRWIDVDGNTTLTWQGQADSSNNIRDRVKHHSNADWIETWVAAPVQPAFAAGPAGRFDVLDQARLIYGNDTMGHATITIPAPIDSLFRADGVTVDPAAAGVAAITAQVVARVVDSQGVPVTRFVRGKRFHDQRQ